MFIDEIIEKLKLEDAVCPFTMTLLGRGHMVVDGVKSVLFTSPEEIRIRLKKGALSIVGDELTLVEIGGGDAYIKGNISGVNIG